VLRDYILIDDMPMHIIDTAGLRESDDVVEREGIRRAQQEIEKADIVLYMQNASESNENIFKQPIMIRNKIDLLNESPSIRTENGCTIISISAKTGAGIDLLKNHIKSQVGYNQQEEGIFLARRRHLDALARAHTHVQAALDQLTRSRSGELAAEDLRLAQLALNEITGEFTADDLLGRIFSSFCIGK
jgi:tRNA modification GTPase